MPTINITEFPGLQSSKNPAGQPYVITEAKNVIFQGGSVRPRWGIRSLIEGPNSNTPRRVWYYQNAFLWLESNNGLHYSDGSWTQYSGTYAAPTNYLVRAAEANQNFYLTTSTGVKKLDRYNSTPRSAGVAPPLDSFVGAIAAWQAATAYTLGTVVSNDAAPVKYYRCITAGTSAGAGGPTGTGSDITDNTVHWAYVSSSTTAAAVLVNNQVAYRVVLGYRDQNKNLILSAPNQRTIFTRASGAGSTANVYGRTYLPSDVSSSSPTFFYQVYRTFGSGTDATEPSNELFLITEKNLTSTDVSNGYVDWIDITPDALVGPTGYFCPSIEGELQANFQPPLARDIANWNGYTFYANTTSKHRLILTLVSVDTVLGVRVDDSVVIAGTTYTAKAAETVASGQFKVTTSGGAAANIEATAKSLVRVINGYASNTSVYAHYVSGYDETPGKILIEERSIGGASFAATASANGQAWYPYLHTSGTTVQSTNDELHNIFFWSKFNQPEHVPLVNSKRLGKEAYRILRMVPLRNAVLVFKEDGLYRLTGEAPFNIELVDPTVRLTVPETARAFNNEVIFVSYNKVLKANEYGVTDISGSIASAIDDAFSSVSVLTESYSVSAEVSEYSGAYVLMNGTSVFAFDGKRWATWNWPGGVVGCGIGASVYYGGSPLIFYLLYASTPTSKGWICTDYFGATSHLRVGLADRLDSPPNISSINTTLNRITFASAPRSISVGDLVWQSGNAAAEVTAIVSSTVVELESVTGFTTGATDLQLAYDSSIKAIVPGGSGTVQKQFGNVAVALSSLSTRGLSASVATDLSSTEGSSTSWTGGVSQATVFSALEASSTVSIARSLTAPLRTYVTASHLMGGQLLVHISHRHAAGYFILDEIATDYEPVSNEVTR